MSPLVTAVVFLVNLALIAYAIGVVSEQRSRRISGRALGERLARAGFKAVLLTGAVLDLVATGCMLAVSTRGLLNPHAILGITALVAMLVAVALAWRHRSRHGDYPVPGWYHLYLRVASVAWLAAYVGGAMMAMDGRG